MPLNLPIVWCLSWLLFLPFFSKGQTLPFFNQYRELHSFTNPASVSPDYILQVSRLTTGISTYWSDKLANAPAMTVFHIENVSQPNTKNIFRLLTGGHIWHGAAQRGVNLRLGGLFLSKNPKEQGVSLGLNMGLKQLKPSENKGFYADMAVGASAYFCFDKEKNHLIKGDVAIQQLFTKPILLENSFPPDSLKTAFYGQLTYIAFTQEFSFLEVSMAITPTHILYNGRYNIQRYCWFGGGFTSKKGVNFEAGLYIGGNTGFKNFGTKLGFSYSSGSRIANAEGDIYELHFSCLMF